MDPDLQKMEAELERMAPGRMPEGMISRMEAAMEGWKDVSWQDEQAKVVPFPLATTSLPCLLFAQWTYLAYLDSRFRVFLQARRVHRRRNCQHRETIVRRERRID